MPSFSPKRSHLFTKTPPIFYQNTIKICYLINIFLLKWYHNLWCFVISNYKHDKTMIYYFFYFKSMLNQMWSTNVNVFRCTCNLIASCYCVYGNYIESVDNFFTCALYTEQRVQLFYDRRNGFWNFWTCFFWKWQKL